MDPITALQLGLPIAGAIGGQIFGKDPNVNRSPGPQESFYDNSYAAQLLRQRQAGGDYAQVNQNVGPSGFMGLGNSMAAQAARQAQPLNQTAQAQWLQEIQSADPQANPYYRDMLDVMGQKAGEHWQERIVPGLQASMVGGGTFGGAKPFITAADKAAEDYVQGITAMSSRDYGQQLAHQGRMLALTPSMTGLGIDQGAKLSQLGLADQQARLAQAQAQMQHHNFQQQRDWAPLLNEAGIHSQLWGAGSPGAPVQPNPVPSGVAQGVGLGFGGAQLLQNLWGNNSAPTPGNIWQDSSYTPPVTYGSSLSDFNQGAPGGFPGLGDFNFRGLGG